MLLRSNAAGAHAASRRAEVSTFHPATTGAAARAPASRARHSFPLPIWQPREDLRTRAQRAPSNAWDRREAFGGAAAGSAGRRRRLSGEEREEDEWVARASSTSGGGSTNIGGGSIGGSSSSTSGSGSGSSVRAASPSPSSPAIGAGPGAPAAAAALSFNGGGGGGGNGDEDAADALATVELIEKAAEKTRLNWLDRFQPPRWLLRAVACAVLGGQVCARLARGRIHWRNTRDQLRLVGPRSLGVALLTAGFVGMVFTIQFVREFAKLGLTRSVGGVLALALARELTPVVTAIILAGRVGSAFAAELGTMQVSEQVDSLRVLFTDPVDYLVTPRVVACMVAGPILNVLCLCMGLGASVLLADLVYSVPANVILDSARRALTTFDVGVSCVKSWVFGLCISTISCAWGFTTTGGAKGVGEATTSAVVISLVTIFVADFFLSFLFFQGSGDALKQLK